MASTGLENIIHSIIQGKPNIPKDATGGFDVIAPYQTEIKLGRVQYAYSQIDPAVNLAKEHQKKWKSVPFAERKNILLDALKRLEANQEPILKTLQIETGRPLHDVKREWTQIESWIQDFKGWNFEEMDARGVIAYVGTHVWPVFHATQFTFLSLLMGNTILVKPSEKTTLSLVQWVRGFLDENDLSEMSLAHAVQVLVGEKEFSRRLVCHDQVNAVIYTGSYEVGIRIKQDTLPQTQKETLLFLGAKNASIVCEDYPAEALDTLMGDAFISAGQHCKSVSVIFVHESQWAPWLAAFHEKAKQFKIGSLEADAWMGPLLDDSMVDRYLKFCGISEREGAEVIMRGKVLVQGKKANFVTPTIVAFDSLSADQFKKSVSLQTEILSPHVTLIRYSSYEDVVTFCNQSSYGLCASIWSGQSERAHKIAKQLEVGDVRINASTIDYSPTRSYQAKKKSGNHAFYGFDLYAQLGLKKQIR